MSCDYRKDGCASTGQVISGKWICLNHMSDEFTALQASHEELVKALKPCLGHLADYLDKCGTNKAQPTLDNAILALANAAKLAPTRTKSEAK
jgi:hypothetical protein